MGRPCSAESAQAWLNRELPNLIAIAEAATALDDWSVAPALSSALGHLLIIQFRHHDGATIHALALRAARADGNRPAEALALAYLGATWGQRGDLVQACSYLEPATQLARAIDSRETEAYAARTLALTHWHLGNHTEAAVLADTALEACRAAGDVIGEATVRANRGAFRWLQGHTTEALRDCTDALAALDTTDKSADHILRVMALTTMSELHTRQGRYEEATTCAERALAIAVASRSRAGEGIALRDLGSVRTAQGRYADAADYLVRALSLLEAINPRSEHYALCCLGELWTRQGRYAEALTLYGRALAYFQTANDPGHQAVALNGLARARLGRREFEVAQNLLTSALQRGHESGWRYEVATAHAGLGHVYSGLSATAASLHHRRQALAIYDDLRVPEADQVRAMLA